MPQCNAVKWIHTVAVDPETGEEVELFNPRAHTWNEHFAWFPSKPELLQARTAIGRATMAFLGLNAPRRVEIRRWLSKIGMHRLSGKVSYLYYPGYAMFAELTRQEEEEEERGLLKEASRIGTREGWEERLREAGVRIEGHGLVES